MQLSLLLWLVIPTDVFRQTFGWTAGFINYNFSLVLLLIYLIVIKNIFGAEKPSYKPALVLPIFVLGFFTQLNVEHVSLFANFTAVFVIIVSFLRFKKFYVLQISYFIGTLLGSILMFMNEAYLNILLHKDGYRDFDVDLSFSEKAIQVYTNAMHYFLFEKNQLLVLILSILFTVFLFKNYPNRIFNYFISSILLGYSITVVFFVPTFPKVSAVSPLTLFSLIYFIGLIIVVAVAFKGLFKWRILYYISGIILTSAPFILIKPYGPRCALAPILFMILISLEMAYQLKKSSEWNFKRLTHWLKIVNVIFAVVYSVIMFANGSENRARMNDLRQQISKGAKVIPYKSLPFPRYGHMLDPMPEDFQTKFFRIENHVPEKVKIKLVP